MKVKQDNTHESIFLFENFKVPMLFVVIIYGTL